jgi:hypothetical protein
MAVILESIEVTIHNNGTELISKRFSCISAVLNSKGVSYADVKEGSRIGAQKVNVYKTFFPIVNQTKL